MPSLRFWHAGHFDLASSHLVSDASRVRHQNGVFSNQPLPFSARLRTRARSNAFSTIDKMLNSFTILSDATRRLLPFPSLAVLARAAIEASQDRATRPRYHSSQKALAPKT